MLALDTFRQAIGVNVKAGMASAGKHVEPQGIDTLFKPGVPLPLMRELQDLLMKEALTRTHGNQTLAADLIGVTRQTLSRRLREQRKGETAD